MSTAKMVPESAVYCTILLSDHYLPGAMVLAHSLRDSGTKAKLVALCTPERLLPATITELQTIYDEIIPVQSITNGTPANLWLMDRPDLISTFTKIELWRQTQFQRIVYIDCDVVAIRAPDELLTLDVDFAAAPDVGWPDCFNSGVMVLRPNLQDYFALKALADRGISFDGADQGLLNMHFRNWHRLSFTYNCTPSANYQYIPAYKHFQSTISLIHFIGAQKPWNMPRQVLPAESPYNQLLGRWWAIYDRHYRPAPTVPIYQSYSRSETPQGGFQHDQTERVTESRHVRFADPTPQDYAVEAFNQPPSEIPPQAQSQSELPPVLHPVYKDETRVHEAPQEQAFRDTDITPSAGISHVENVQTGAGESHAGEPHSREPHSGEPHSGEPHSGESHSGEPHAGESAQLPIRSSVPQYVRGEEHVSAYIHPHSHETSFVLHTEQPSWEQAASGPLVAPQPTSGAIESQAWQRSEVPVFEAKAPSPAPPSEPEEPIFEPPKAEWDASREPPPLNSKPEGFALEKIKNYTMSDDHQLFQPPASYPEAPKNMYYKVPETKPEPKKLTQLFPWESHAPKPTRVFLDDDEQSSVSTLNVKPSTSPTTEESRPSASARSWTSWTTDEATVTWDSYTRSNAWDDVPEIQKYIQSIHQPRKAKVQVISGGPSSGGTGPSFQELFGPQSSVRVTDFPSELERPSLPVTPAPIRRRSSAGYGQGKDTDDEQLPIAEGVPNQEDWNPLSRLEELHRRHSEALENPDLLFNKRP